MAVAKIYQAGAFVVYTSTGVVPLTLEVGSDANNWADSITLFYIAGLSSTSADTLNNWVDSPSYTPGIEFMVGSDLANWLDSFSIGIAIAIELGDTFTLSDAVTRAAELFLTRGDTLAFSDSVNRFLTTNLSLGDSFTLTDALVISNVTHFLRTLSDQLSMSDALTIEGAGSLTFNDNLNRWSDSISRASSNLLVLADSLNNWLDDATVGGLVEQLLATLESNLNGWDDSVTNDFLSRLSKSRRANLIPYIRRYLNDPTENAIGEIHVSLGDNSGFWNDRM